MRPLRVAIGFTVFVILMAVTLMFLKPPDHLAKLTRYSIQQDSVFVEYPSKPPTFMRIRNIYVKDLSFEAASSELKSLCPKTAGWSWSSDPRFAVASKGEETVVLGPPSMFTPTRNSPTPDAATLQIVEYLPLDGRHVFWEKFVHLGRNPVDKIPPT